MRNGSTRRALALPLLSLLLLACRASAEGPAPREQAPAVVEAPKPVYRTARLSIRVEGTGEDARLEIPLVQSEPHQQLISEKIIGRGFSVQEVVRDGNRLAVLTHPKLKGHKRVSYEFTVALRPHSAEVVPTPVADADSDGEDAVWLRPTLKLQSSSPLIREKLIRYAEPRMRKGETDAIRIAWDLTRTYELRPKGSKTVLKATRTGHASDRGYDRLFATFLRTSGVPARPVQGVDLSLKKKGGRFITWVEVKSGGAWVPMSVSRDQWGTLPTRHVKLSHGDRPLIVREGIKSLRFRWIVTRPKKTVQEASR